MELAGAQGKVANPLFTGGENILDTHDHMGAQPNPENPLWESKQDNLR